MYTNLQGELDNYNYHIFMGMTYFRLVGQEEKAELQYGNL